MRLGSTRQSADEDDEIRDPDNRQPQIHIPLGLGIFAALRDAKKITRSRENDKQLVAPEYEPSERREGKLGAARALHHVETAGDKDIAAKSENHCRRMQRPHPPEVEIGLEIELRERQLRRDKDAGK